MLIYLKIQEIKRFSNRPLSILNKQEHFDYIQFIMIDVLSIIVYLMLDIVLLPLELISAIIWFVILKKKRII